MVIYKIGKINNINNIVYYPHLMYTIEMCIEKRTIKSTIICSYTGYPKFKRKNFRSM